jgi:hypothetical protein
MRESTPKLPAIGGKSLSQWGNLGLAAGGISRANAMAGKTSDQFDEAQFASYLATVSPTILINIGSHIDHFSHTGGAELRHILS